MLKYKIKHHGLSNNVQLDLKTGHHAAIRILDGGGGVVGSTTEEPGNDVRNLRDGDDEGLPTTVCPGVQGGGALLGKVDFSRLGSSKQLHTKQQWMIPSKNQGKAEVKVDFSKLGSSKQLHTKQQWMIPSKNQGKADVKVDFNKLGSSKQL